MNTKCSNCDSKLDNKGLCPECDYCSECGSKLDSAYFCPQCDFCLNCGEFTDGGLCDNCIRQEINENDFIINASQIESDIRKIVLQNDVELHQNQRLKVRFDGKDYYTDQKRMSGRNRKIFFKNPNHWNTSPVKTLKHICFSIFLKGKNLSLGRSAVIIDGERVKINSDDINNLSSWGLIYINGDRILPTKDGYDSFLKSIDSYYRFHIDYIPVELRTIPYIGHSSKKSYSISNYYKIDSRIHLTKHKKIVSDALIQIKENKDIHYLECISELISWFYEKNIQELESDVIVPIPCYEKKICHTYEIAKLVKENLKIELQCPLEKRYDTSQDGYGPEQRWYNARRSYALSNNTNIQGKTVLLIDDIYTTGATINVCKDLLYDAGAKQVNCLTVTRTRDTYD